MEPVIRMNKLNLLMVVTAIVGLVDSIYLYILKISNNQNLCIQGIGDCWSVNISPYSEINGIPVALLGALAYIFILGVLLFEKKIPFLTTYSTYILFGTTLTGLLYSIYLTYLEIAVIKAICPFCVISAIAMLVLFVCALIRMFNTSGND